MARVYSREGGWGQSDLLTDTLIEDITQQVTSTLPVITVAERIDVADQHKDIAATAKGAGIVGLGNLMSMALRYVTNIAMARMVSPTVFGAFGEVMTATSLLGTLANLGFGATQTYLLPGYRVKDERSLVSGLVRFSSRIVLISAFLLGLLFFAFAPVIARAFYHAPSYELILREVAPLILLTPLTYINIGGLQAFKEIRWKVCIEFGLALITLIALVGFHLLGWRMEALTFSALSGYIFSLLIAQRVFRKAVKRFAGNTAPAYAPRVWFSFALPLLFSEQIFSLGNTTDILFLSIFATPAQAAVYIAANRFGDLVSLPLAVLNVISVPMLAEYYAKGEQKQLERMFKLVTKWALSLSLPICLCCLVFHDAILSIFGSHYTSGWIILIILCFTNLTNTGTGPVLQLLAMTKRVRITSIDSILHLVLNVVVSLILVPRFNILGAAVAGVLVDILTNGLGTLQVYWIMKLHPYRWDICKPLLAGGVATLVGMLLQHFVHLQSGLGIFAIFVELGLMILFTLVYILLLVLLGFSEEDRIVFRSMLARLGRQRSTRSV